MKKFIEKESFMHLHAKNLLLEELRKVEQSNEFYCTFGPLKWRSNYGVFSELKFHEKDNYCYFECSEGLIITGNVPLINGDEWFDPSIDRGKILFVPDITIFHKGSPKYIIEVVHKNKVTEYKKQCISRFFSGIGIEVYEVSAYDIMSQVNTLENVVFNLILEHNG